MERVLRIPSAPGGSGKLTDRVIFFPVRHHSPACARSLRLLALEQRPSAILIEGPSDFNSKIHEIFLPHVLPIAIYSYVRLKDGTRSGAYYPFCIYSPEWQALQIAAQLRVPARFIDLPWAEICRIENRESTQAQRYAEPQLRYSHYVRQLCSELGVDNFDELWDELFEVDPASPQVYMDRAALFCSHSRDLDEVRQTDSRRETFMADQILQGLQEFDGPLLVVTGGYHTSALREMVEQGGTHYTPSVDQEWEERGLALTPYSYARLDQLTGYDAGMPAPGFYHHVWQARDESRPFDYTKVLSEVTTALRRRQQTISTADLIAGQTTAIALAQLRGHQEVWRRDLVDGLRGSLLKDEVARGGVHPLLDAIDEVFRGWARGRLAVGVSLPPLYHDITERLRELGLDPEAGNREVELNLENIEDREKSRLLHKIRLLGVTGFSIQSGTDFVQRIDLSSVQEKWKLFWTPDLMAHIIEAARYGPTLSEAATAVLVEQTGKLQRDIVGAAKLLVDAALAGLGQQGSVLYQKIQDLVRTCSDFLAVSSALTHILYVYRYDTVLELANREKLGPLVEEFYLRCLWLFEALGSLSGKDKALLQSVRILVDTFERCNQSLGLKLDELTDVLMRVQNDANQTAGVRGAAVGALWVLGRAVPERVLADMRLFSDPSRLGDFLAGLFALARETAQREGQLIKAIDELLSGYSEDEFLEALPSLRLAFTYFTPREKHYIAMKVLELAGLKEALPMQSLVVSPETASRALAFEGRLYETLQKYGIRGK